MAHSAMAASPLRFSSRPWLSSLLSTTTTTTNPDYHRFIPFSSSSFRASALRPPSTLLPQRDNHPDDDDNCDERRSRNELKCEARRCVKWGMELARFSPLQIKRVLRVASLDEDVFDAIMLVKRLGPDVREGKRRQFNYIGRLLREAQPELLEALIQASKDGDNNRLLALSNGKSLIEDEEEEEEEEEDTLNVEEEGYENHIEVAAKWMDGLIYKDQAITKEVYSIHNVEFDRQELRKLVRQVQSIQEGMVAEGSERENDSKLTRAKQPLILFLHSLAKKSLTEES